MTKVTQIAQDRLISTAQEAQTAVTSAAWRYPLLGVAYLISHPSLFLAILPSLVQGLIVSLGVVAGLFFVTYLPQVAVLAFVSGPLAFVGAVPLVLAEAFVLINFFGRKFLFGKLATDLFDQVLAQQGCQLLVTAGQQREKSGRSKQIRQVFGNPLAGLSLDNLVRYVLTLPLNFIPVVGTVVFLGINGHRVGPGYHSRYFQLKGFTTEEQKSFVGRNRGAYSAFGTMSLALDLIPVVSMLFIGTTSIGAALWAAELDKKAKKEF